MMNETKYLNIPTVCPICGSLTEIVQDNDSKVLTCTNLDCKGKLLGKLVHFCSKSGVNIDGLSEFTLEKFIELEWVTCFEDIYKLDKHASEMVWLDGFGKKSVIKLLDSIEKSRTITLDKFICALSIPLIGRTASKTIAEHFNYDVDDFLFACDNMIDYDFTKIEGFGETMAKSIDNYTDNHYYEMAVLADHFTFTKPEAASASTSLAGLTFVITGSVNKFANRDEVKAKIEALGGKVAGSVSKNTNFLVNNDVNSTSSKNKKAKELGVSIITEDELIKMMEG